MEKKGKPFQCLQTVCRETNAPAYPQPLLPSHEYALLQLKMQSCPVIRKGFRIGFDYSQYQCRKAKCNMLSARQNSGVVTEYLEKECHLGRLIGPLKKGSIDTHINRWGHPETPSARKVAANCGTFISRRSQCQCRH